MTESSLALGPGPCPTQRGVDSLASPNPCNSTGFLLWVGGHILRSFYRQFRFDAEAEKPRLASLARGRAAGLHLPPASAAPSCRPGLGIRPPLPQHPARSCCTLPEVGEAHLAPGQAVPTEKISCHQPGSTFRVPGAGPGCARRGFRLSPCVGMYSPRAGSTQRESCGVCAEEGPSGFTRIHVAFCCSRSSV